MSLGEIQSGDKHIQRELPFGESKYEKLLEATHTMEDTQLFILLEQEGITSQTQERNQWNLNTYYTEEGRTFHTMSFSDYWTKERKPELIRDFERILEHEAETYADLQEIKKDARRQAFSSIRAAIQPK